MALFSRATLETLRPLLLRVARVEAQRLRADQLGERGPFSEDRLRLLGLWAQDTGVDPGELGGRLATEPDTLWHETLAWRAAIDPAAEAAAIADEGRALSKLQRKLVNEMLGYVGHGERFGAGGPVDRIKGAFADLEAYCAYAPSRRGLLAGRIEAGQSFNGGLAMNVLADEVYSGRYSYALRGHCDKLWDDLTYVRPPAIAFWRELQRRVLAGESAVDTAYLQRARATFRAAYDGDVDAYLADLDWWTVRELVARRDQRMQMRRQQTVQLLGDLSLAPGGAHYDVYWVFDEVLAPLEVLVECKQRAPRRMATFAIDALIRFQPPASAAAFHYDTQLMLAEAALAEDPPARIASRLRGLTDFGEYHQLLRNAWAMIQHLIAGGSVRCDGEEGVEPTDGPPPGLAGDTEETSR